MKTVYVIFCCFSVVCMEASEIVEVLNSHVGSEVTIRCFGNWMAKARGPFDMYLCKELCYREDALIGIGEEAITQQGRYILESNRENGAFNVTIKGLKMADSGNYNCVLVTFFDILSRKVILKVSNASIVPSGSPPSTTTLQNEAETLPQGNIQSSTAPSPAVLTVPAAEKTNEQAETKLTDTTVVIIVSVSLAVLVCAIIPLIFYGHCREGRNRSGTNKHEADYCEENTDVASTHAVVRLQSLELAADPESSPPSSTSQYAAIYQALDPKSLD